MADLAALNVSVGPESAPSPVLRAVIRGEPQSKQRPRVGAAGRVYTPRQTREAEERLGWLIRAHGPIRRLEGASLRLAVSFHCGGRRRRDLDNLLKLVMDACNGVVWGDDSQVEEVTARLHRGDPDPRTELEVWTLPPAPAEAPSEHPRHRAATTSPKRPRRSDGIPPRPVLH